MAKNFWNWAFFFFSCFNCLVGAWAIRQNTATGLSVFNMVFGLFSLGLFANVIGSQKESIPVEKKDSPKKQTEDEKWASYLVKR